MNRLIVGGLLVLAVAAMIFLSGCVSQDSSKSSASPQTATTSSTTTPKPLATTTTSPQTVATTSGSTSADSGLSDLLIKPADVPGRNLANFDFMAGEGDLIGIRWYKDVLPVGMINFGQSSQWNDNTGKQVLTVDARKFNSKSRTLVDIPNSLKYCDDLKKYSPAICGPADFGDISYFEDMNDPSDPDAQITQVVFTKGDIFVLIKVVGKKDTSNGEAMRLAKLVESRL